MANALATEVNEPTRQMKWFGPASGTIKLNVDASFHPESGVGATGALLWDSIEKFIAASCSYEEFSMDASMEAFILLEGLCLVDELRIYSVVVECDSMEIVHAILDPSEY